MNNSEHTYTPPRVRAANDIPAGVLDFFNGQDLLSKTQAIRLSTIDPEGWPHAAVLSAGEILILPNGRFRFVLFPKSTVAANLTRDGRLTMAMCNDKGMCELRMQVRKLGVGTGEVPLAFFEGELKTIREHVSPYADIVQGLTFTLHEPQIELKRWQKQIAALRSLFPDADLRGKVS